MEIDFSKVVGTVYVPSDTFDKLFCVEFGLLGATFWDAKFQNRVNYNLWQQSAIWTTGCAENWDIVWFRCFCNLNWWWRYDTVIHRPVLKTHVAILVDRTALPTEWFRSSAFCCCGPVDLEFAAWQPSWPRAESQHFQASTEDTNFCNILTTKRTKCIGDFFIEYAVYKFTLYILTYLLLLIANKD